MAGKVDEDKKLALAAPLLPLVTVEEEKKKVPPEIPAVELVRLWALLTGVLLLGSFAFAYALVRHDHDIHLPSWMLPRPGRMTDAAVAEIGAINHGMMWSSAAQAAVAAAALLLPGRWISGGGRRALAYVALAATAASHLMLARVPALFVTADPANIYSWITGAYDVYFLVMGDLHCLMALLGRGDYAN